MRDRPLVRGTGRVIPAVALLVQTTFCSSDATSAGEMLPENLETAVDSAGIGETALFSCSKIPGSALTDSSIATLRFVIETPESSLLVSLADLAALPFCSKGLGGFTTSAGTSVVATWAGISLPALLSERAGLEGCHSVTVVGDDGYRMTFDGREILDQSEGTWILAISREGMPIRDVEGFVRMIKVGPQTPMVTGHVAVAGVRRITITSITLEAWRLAMRGKMDVDVDRQTLQSCVSCHGAVVPVVSGGSVTTYEGVPLHHLVAFSDDSLYAPHQQDGAIISYRADLAQTGYLLEVGNAAGQTIILDSRRVHQNDGIVLALYRDDEPLPEHEAPVVLVNGGGKRLAEGKVLPSVSSVTLKLP